MEYNILTAYCQQVYTELLYTELFINTMYKLTRIKIRAQFFKNYSNIKNKVSGTFAGPDAAPGGRVLRFPEFL